MRGKAGREPRKVGTFYIPMHVDASHWCGAKVQLIKQENGSLRMEMEGMDSLYGGCREEFVRLYRELYLGFKSEWETWGVNSILEGPMEDFELADARNHIAVDRKTWPRQRNGVDCAVFMMRWMECDSLGLPCNHSQRDMHNFRRLTFVELSHGAIIRHAVFGTGISIEFSRLYPLAKSLKSHMLDSDSATKATSLTRPIETTDSDSGDSGARITCVVTGDAATKSERLDPVGVKTTPNQSSEEDGQAIRSSRRRRHNIATPMVEVAVIQEESPEQRALHQSRVEPL